MPSTRHNVKMFVRTETVTRNWKKTWDFSRLLQTATHPHFL